MLISLLNSTFCTGCLLGVPGGGNGIGERQGEGVGWGGSEQPACNT